MQTDKQGVNKADQQSLEQSNNFGFDSMPPQDPQGHLSDEVNNCVIVKTAQNYGFNCIEDLEKQVDRDFKSYDDDVSLKMTLEKYKRDIQL